MPSKYIASYRHWWQQATTLRERAAVRAHFARAARGTQTTWAEVIR